MTNGDKQKVMDCKVKGRNSGCGARDKIRYWVGALYWEKGIEWRGQIYMGYLIPLAPNTVSVSASSRQERPHDLRYL